MVRRGWFGQRHRHYLAAKYGSAGGRRYKYQWFRPTTVFEANLQAVDRNEAARMDSFASVPGAIPQDVLARQQSAVQAITPQTYDELKELEAGYGYAGIDVMPSKLYEGIVSATGEQSKYAGYSTAFFNNKPVQTSFFNTSNKLINEYEKAVDNGNYAKYGPRINEMRRNYDTLDPATKEMFNGLFKVYSMWQLGRDLKTIPPLKAGDVPMTRLDKINAILKKSNENRDLSAADKAFVDLWVGKVTEFAVREPSVMTQKSERKPTGETRTSYTYTQGGASAEDIAGAAREYAEKQKAQEELKERLSF